MMPEGMIMYTTPTCRIYDIVLRKVLCESPNIESSKEDDLGGY